MRIFYDLTTAANAIGNPVGIPRVVKSAYDGLAKIAEVVPIVFDAQNSCFLELSFGTLDITKRSPSLVDSDVLLSLGCSWDYRDYNKAIRTLKRRGDFRYVHLFHDIIPCLFPNFVPSDVAKIYENWFLETYRLMDSGLTISNNSSNDIQSYATKNGLLEKPIHVITLGDTSFGPEPKFKLEKEPYVLCVGTLEARKNQPLLIEVWNELTKRGLNLPNLLFVGKIGWAGNHLFEFLEKFPLLKGKVDIQTDVTDATLYQLYLNAEFTAYPSLYEGWGLPISESLRLGKACIASETSSMKEAGQGLAIHADPRNPSDWFEKVSRLVTDINWRHEIEVKINNEYRPKTWKNTCTMILELIS